MKVKGVVWSKAILILITEVVSDAEPVLLFLVVHASLSEKLFFQYSSPPEKEVP